VLLSPFVTSSLISPPYYCLVKRTSYKSHYSIRSLLLLSSFSFWLKYSPQYSPPCSAEGQEWWSYISTPPYVFMAWCLIK
jgi:hypothetical protein